VVSLDADAIFCERGELRKDIEAMSVAAVDVYMACR
jgi:hypothetical protein